MPRSATVMVSFILTGLIIYLYLKELNVGTLGRIVAVALFAINLNVLYLQSTAMTELLILFTMTAGSYELLKWHKTDNILHLIKAAFWIMLSTLTRYDGWFLLAYATFLVGLHIISQKIPSLGTKSKVKDIWTKIKSNYQKTEGI